jgi:SOS-response transcriptional repressor LexA
MGGEKACIAKYYGRDSDSVTVGLMMSFDAPGQEWANDPYCYRKAAEEVMRALARYRPRGEIEGPDDHLVSESEREEWFGSLLAFFERQSEWRPDIPTILTAGAAEALKIARRVDLEDRARRLRRDAERLQRITDLDLPVYMGADLDHWVAFLEGLQSRGQVFFQTIPDDALASIGFTKGDMVVFQQVDAPPPDGEIVAALVDRREAVFGVYRRDGGDVLLETTRPGDKPRRLEAERVAVVGRLWGRADEFAQRLQTILERNTRAPQATGSKSNAAVDHASADPNSKQGSEKNRKLAPARNRSIKGITKPKKGPA